MILAIALVHLAVVVSPGANFLIVTRNSLTYTRQAGLLTARGVALGSLTYITIGLLGFATIIAGSPVIFNLIKWIGTLYFFYIGVKTLYSLHSPRNPPRTDNQFATSTPSELSSRAAFFSGAGTALANPTAALYFLSLFTTFVETSAPAGEKILTGAVLVTISFTWYSIVAATFSIPRVRAFYLRFEKWLNGFIGLLWIALGIKLLMTPSA
jgi:RhtB (resistance to homoserine/threonine) family protein